MPLSRYVWSFFVLLNSVLLVVVLGSMLVVPRGSASYYTAQITAFFLILPIIFSLVFLYIGWEPFD